MKQMTMTLLSMYAAASQLGYSLPFMNKICKRAFWSGRPFHVLKDANNKDFVEENSLQRFIDSCSDFNPFEIPGVYEPDNYAEDAPMDESVFILTEDMLPQVCGVLVDDECAPLITYNRNEPALLVLTVVETDETEKRCYPTENLLHDEA